MTHYISCTSQLERDVFGAVLIEAEHKNNPLLSLGENAKTIKNIFLFFCFDAGTASYDVWIFWTFLHELSNTLHNRGSVRHPSFWKVQTWPFVENSVKHNGDGAENNLCSTEFKPQRSKDSFRTHVLAKHA